MQTAEEAAPPRTLWVVLGFAVLGISSSAVIVRGMEGAHPLAIAVWRTFGAALLLSPALRRGLPALGLRDALAIGVAGAFLGLHFWTWFASVQATTVLRSTLLVCLTPAWTGLLEWALDGVRPRATYALGLLVALPGVLLLGEGGGRASLAGDGLALLAGGLWSVYMLVGRQVRQRVDAGTYMALACGTAAAVLLPLALAAHVPLAGYSPRTWALLGLAVALPQLVGHQGFAWAVKWVRASTISALTLLEPVGAALLAVVLLGEIPGPRAAAGAALVLLGIALATRER